MFYIIGALFAIVIGVVLLVNVMGAGSGASNSSQVAEAVNEVNQIRTGVKALGYGHSFAGLDNDVLENGGVMPPELIAGAVGAGNDLDSWSAAVVITSNCTNSTCFSVEFDSVPRAACIALASQVFVPATMQGQTNYSVTINATSYGTVGEPLSPSSAAAACVAQNNLQWAFND